MSDALAQQELDSAIALLNKELASHELRKEHPPPSAISQLGTILRLISRASYQDVSSRLARLIRMMITYRRSGLHCLIAQALHQCERLQIDTRPQLSAEDVKGFSPTEFNVALNSFKGYLALNRQFRLSARPLPHVPLPEASREKLVVGLPQTLSEEFLAEVWQENLTPMLLRCVLSRACAEDSERLLDLHYFALLGICPQVQQHNGQLARDLAEELVLCSCLDGQPAWGFALSADLYMRQRDMHTGLLYFSLAAHCLRHQRRPVPASLYFVLVNALQRGLRDLGLLDLETEVYEMLLNGPLTHVRRRVVTKVHFECLLTVQPDWATVETALAYLETQRANICEGGAVETTPWLGFLALLEGVTPSSALRVRIAELQTCFAAASPDSKKTIDVLVGDDYHGLKDLLERQLVAQAEIRDKADLATELQSRALQAKQLLRLAFERNDHDGVLLASHYLIDPSFLHVDRDVPVTRELHPSAHSEARPVVDLFAFLSRELPRHQLVIVLDGVDRLYVLHKGPDEEAWQGTPLAPGTSKQWTELPKDVVQRLRYADKSGDIRYEDDVRAQWEDYHCVQRQLAPAALPCHLLAPTCVLTSVETSNYPVNVITDPFTHFAALARPVVNLVTPLCLLRPAPTLMWKETPTRQWIDAWIPADSGDPELNFVYSKLQDCSVAPQISFVTEVNPSHRMTAELTLLCAHGGGAMGELPALSFELFDLDAPERGDVYKGHRQFRANPEQLIESARVVVLFVCYGGVFNPGFFEYRKMSLVRKLLEAGVVAVVAPHWPLNVQIPAMWLPPFVESLHAGSDVARAVFDANRSIFLVNKNPGAWAAMHTFGDPRCGLPSRRSQQSAE